MLIDARPPPAASTDIAETDVYYFAPQKNFSSDGGLWLALLPGRAGRGSRRGRRYHRNMTTRRDNSRRADLNTPALARCCSSGTSWAGCWILGAWTSGRALPRSTQTLYDWAESRDFASPFVTDPEHRSPVVATIDIDEAIPVADLIAILRRNGIRDIDPYRALNRNQIRVGCYASVDPEDVAALTACLDHVVDV